MQIKYIKNFIIIASIMLLAGCSDFFEKESTELETRKTLDELGRLKPNRNVDNPLPELYRQPAQRLNINGKVKLFYFTKHHTVDKLTNLVISQMGVKVDQSPAINQLIIECKDDTHADEILSFLEKIDVPPIQVNIDCIVLERFADITMDWETKIRIENILGEGIWASGKDSEHLAFPGAALRETKRSDFGLDLGILRGEDGHKVKAVVDMLVSRGYLKILMNPSLETINGQTATVESMEETKQEKIVTGTEGSYSTTTYVPVTDILQVTPNVFVDGSIGLQTTIKLGSASKPEGVSQVSVRTERSVTMKENRIAPGDSLVIGGMRKSTKRSVIRGVPFFKDLPLLGIFFSSKDFEEKGTEVIFILTPSISSGAEKYTEMAERINEKHSIPERSRGLEETLTDPLGLTRYSEEARKTAAEAEFEKFKAELEVSQAKDQLLKKAEDMMKEKQKALRAARQAKQAKQEAEKLKAEAEKIKQSYEQTTQEIQQKEQLSKQQAAKIKEIQKTLEAAQQKAQAAEKKYQSSEQKESQTRQQLENLKKQTQQLREELEKVKKQAEEKLSPEPQPKDEQKKQPEEDGKTEEKSDPNSES